MNDENQFLPDAAVVAAPKAGLLPAVYDHRALPLLDLSPTQHGKKGELMVTNGKVNITIAHPTNSGEEVAVAVSKAATPQFLINQLINAGFMQAIPDEEGRYDIKNSATGAQIPSASTLEAAGVTDGSRLRVIPALNGA